MQRVKVLIVIIAAMFAVSHAEAQKFTSTQLLQQRYMQAQDLFEKEKYASAQQKFDELRVAAAGSTTQVESDAAYYAALCSDKLNNDDAESRLLRFLADFPQSSRRNMAQLHLGNQYYRKGDYAKALECYRKVDKVGVEYGYRSEYDFKNAYCLFDAGDIKRAKPIFAQLANGQSKYRNASIYYYAHIQYMEREYDQSLKNFQQIADEKSFSKVVPSYIARLYYYLGRYDELLELAPQLLAQDNVYKKNEIKQMVAEVYYNRGEYDNALDYYRTLQTDDATGDVDIAGKMNRKTTDNADQAVCTPQDNYYQMGYCYYMTGQLDSAAMFLAKKSVCDDSVAQNALYTLGDIYIKQGKKDEARSMFLQASRFDHDPKIQEDALYNYAKLSCELNKNPYNESIRSFQNYLKKYPRTQYRSEIQEILASLYLSTRNYKDALTLIEKIPDRSVAMNRAYQRIVLNRGIEIFNTGDVAYASEYFKKAVKINVEPKVTADANYLLGEAYYRMEDYDNAYKAIDKFLLSSGAKRSSYYPQALYTQGYLCMKRQQYDDAEAHFKDYVVAEGTSVTDHQAYDVYNRIGDCRYVRSAFDAAITYYDKVIAAGDKDADYATYQKAMAYGAKGNIQEKLHHLNYIFERYNNSPLASKAQLEIANTYLICDNNEMALLYFDNFVKRYPNSVYVKNALFDMGLVYYNESRYDEALAVFDRLLTEYAGTTEARDALVSVKDIYVKQNRVDEYFTYVQRTAKITVSTVEQDSTVYFAAEDRYMEGDYNQAVVGMENYLSHFPNGLFVLQAHYYAADAYARQSRQEQALPHYEAVALAAKNQFTETAQYNGANIAFSLSDYGKALQLYRSLSANSENDQNRVYGLVGALRCETHVGGLGDIIAAARQLLDEAKTSEAERDEANLAMARSYYGQHRYDSAAYYYAALETSSNGEYSGEAFYYRAERLYAAVALSSDKNRFKEAEKVIETIVANPSSDYWLAKTFILWADIYNARGNTLQAKQTLQSIIDNYDGDDLVQVAREKLAAIVAAEQPQAAADEESPVIEL